MKLASDTFAVIRDLIIVKSNFLRFSRSQSPLNQAKHFQVPINSRLLKKLKMNDNVYYFNLITCVSRMFLSTSSVLPEPKRPLCPGLSTRISEATMTAFPLTSLSLDDLFFLPNIIDGRDDVVFENT